MEEHQNHQDEKLHHMTTAPVEKLVVSLGIPSVIIMMISGIYNLADTYFVSSLGTSAVAAVGIVFPLMAIIQALGFLFGQGSGNYISRELGAKHFDKASQMAATGFISSFIATGTIAIVGLIFINPLSLALGSTPTILPHALDYMLFILIGGPFMAASQVLNNQLRFQGSSFYAMFGMIAGAVLNIILDPLFIFGLHLGVLGASLATAISQFVGCIVLLVGCTKKGNIRINPKHFSPSIKNYLEIARGGIPSLLRQGLQSAATILINHLAGVYGDAAIAAISIVNRLGIIAGSTVLGIGQGFQPVCGFNYGAKLYGRVKKAFWFCARFATIAMTILALLMAIFAPQIISLFRKDDPELIAIGVRYLRFHCIAMPFLGWVVLCNMMTQTMGKARIASLLALSRQGLFLLPFLLIFPALFGLLGIQLSQPASDIASFFFTIPFVVKILRKELKEE
ncbi:MATE family efflux transporter [Treponema primitia]|uniref:MATE family efflux transporter n=1 Tax=Treponema primitia TaxID=88058 RepID=UPI0002555213|nr:MATE family efflux transporter [Treponema primitia]